MSLPHILPGITVRTLNPQGWLFMFCSVSTNFEHREFSGTRSTRSKFLLRDHEKCIRASSFVLGSCGCRRERCGRLPTAAPNLKHLQPATDHGRGAVFRGISAGKRCAPLYQPYSLPVSTSDNMNSSHLQDLLTWSGLALFCYLRCDTVSGACIEFAVHVTSVKPRLVKAPADQWLTRVS